MKVIFTQGLPGSGKSTWAKDFCEKNKDWVRINRDDLRNMRGKYWIPKDEKLISNWEQEMILDALEFGKNVIVDATNFNVKYVNQIKEMCSLAGKVDFEVKFFDTPLEKCIERDMKRANSVGEKVIRGMYNKYLKEDQTVKQDSSLRHAIICDLDGTLCIHNGRSPFDYQKCHTDLPNIEILDLVKRYKETTIIFLSGREDSCYDKTRQWIREKFKARGIPMLVDNEQIFLIMRKTGDHRKDSIIKKELFEQHIKDKYYVKFVLDDRNQVVDMWRDLGLTCLQVAEGDF